MTTVRVFAVGGSILAPDGPDAAYAAAFADLMIERLAKGERVVIVTGGGAPARRYIEAARPLGVDEHTLDLLGIAATRLNARYLAAVLHRAAGPGVGTEVPVSAREARDASAAHPVVVMGGTEPGHSTDYVAASVATAVGADHLYVLTNVDGVYTADPKADEGAERLPELSSSRLLEIVGDPAWTAGRAGVVDPLCARHVHEHRLPVTVLDGRDLDALRADLGGVRSAGTVVHPDAVPTPDKQA